MKISVLVICCDSRFFTELCLDALQAATCGLEAELVVIDNASADRVSEAWKPLFPDVKFVRTDVKKTPEEIHRLYFPDLTGEYVLLLDPHVIVGEDCIRTFVCFMDEHPDAGAVGPLVLDAHGRFVASSKRCFPSLWARFCRKSGLSALFPASPCFNGYYLPRLDRDRMHRVDIVSESFILLRRRALLWAGWPVAGELKYGEDVAVAGRLAEAGMACYYLPERALRYAAHFPAKRPAARRLLLLAGAGSYREVRAACETAIPGLEYVCLWNLDENRALDAVCRSNQMKGFTDLAVCYPDVRFEQLMLLMERMGNRNITYHIYNKKNGVVFSPPEKR